MHKFACGEQACDGIEWNGMHKGKWKSYKIMMVASLSKNHTLIEEGSKQRIESKSARLYCFRTNILAELNGFNFQYSTFVFIAYLIFFVRFSCLSNYPSPVFDWLTFLPTNSSWRVWVCVCVCIVQCCCADVWWLFAFCSIAADDAIMCAQVIHEFAL